MRHRPQVAHVAAAFLAFLLTVSSAARSRSNGCRPRVNPRDALLTGGYRAPDKKLHFRIAYDHNVGQFHKMAFRRAMDMWNDYSLLTDIVFEETKTADVDFRLQRGAAPHLRNPEETERDKCSAYFSAGSYIWYSPANMDWVKTEAEVPTAARVYAHELGHALNLDDQGSGDTVMHAGDSEKACQHLASSVLSDIKEADALKVHRCAHDVRTNWAQELEQERERAKRRR